MFVLDLQPILAACGHSRGASLGIIHRAIPQEIVTDVEKATKYIMVHAVKFQSIDVTIKKHGTNENVEIKQTFLYAPNQYFVIEAAQIFEPGTYKLRFVYDFVLRKDLAGFYQSSYKTKTGEIR